MRRHKSACRRTSWRLFDDDPAELEAGGEYLTAATGHEHGPNGREYAPHARLSADVVAMHRHA